MRVCFPRLSPPKRLDDKSVHCRASSGSQVSWFISVMNGGKALVIKCLCLCGEGGAMGYTHTHTHTHTHTRCGLIAKLIWQGAGLAQMRMAAFEHSRRTAQNKDRRKSMALSCMALSNPTLPETIGTWHTWSSWTIHTHTHTDAQALVFTKALHEFSFKTGIKRYKNIFILW